MNGIDKVTLGGHGKRTAFKEIGTNRAACRSKADPIACRKIRRGQGMGGLYRFWIRICVMEDKCLDLLFMKYKGVNLSFLAKPGPVAPSYFNVHGMEFGRYFMVGCYIHAG